MTAAGARPRAGRRRPAPSGRPWSRPPTSAPWPTWPRWPRWRTHTACRWWSTRRGARTSPSTTDLPAHALSLGADLVISSIHKIVGQPHPVGHDSPGPRRACSTRTWSTVASRCVESTSPNALLFGVARLGAPRGGNRRRGAARRDAQRPARHARAPSARSPASTCSTSGSPARPGCTTTTLCGLRLTCAEPHAAATSWPACCASRTTCRWSSPART